jgi:hypothetical protein
MSFQSLLSKPVLFHIVGPYKIEELRDNGRQYLWVMLEACSFGNGGPTVLLITANL